MLVAGEEGGETGEYSSSAQEERVCPCLLPCGKKSSRFIMKFKSTVCILSAAVVIVSLMYSKSLATALLGSVLDIGMWCKKTVLPLIFDSYSVISLEIFWRLFSLYDIHDILKRE